MAVVFVLLSIVKSKQPSVLISAMNLKRSGSRLSQPITHQYISAHSTVHPTLLRKPLELLLNRHKNKLPHILIAGDVNYGNIDWSTSSANSVSNGSNFVDILNDYFLNQLVNSPTRFSATTASILDLVICSHPALIENLVVGRELSDHCMISFDIALSTSLFESLPRKIFLYSRGNYDQLRSDIHTFSNSFLVSSPELKSVNDNWLALKGAIQASVCKNVPSKLASSRTRRPPWLNSSVRKAIRTRDTLAKLAKKLEHRSTETDTRKQEI
jgi:hypothetical protein